MSRDRLLAGLSAVVILAGSGTAIVRNIDDGEGHAPAIGIPSGQYWGNVFAGGECDADAHREADKDAAHEADAGRDAGKNAGKDGECDGGGDPDAGPGLLPVSNVLYQGNTDERFLQLTRQAAKLPATGHNWRNVGPFNGVKSIPGVGSGDEQLGDVGGIGTTITVDPSDKSGNTVYLGTIGGLYKSTNGGKTVRNITEGKVPREAVGAFAIDPHNPKLLVLGTGVSIFTLSDDAAGTGVYVSRNGGKTWQHPAANVHGYGTNAIAINPKNHDIYVGTNYGLWRSTDEGHSFHRVHLPDRAKYGLDQPLVVVE